jgi:hypothetical protein
MAPFFLPPQNPSGTLLSYLSPTTTDYSVKYQLTPREFHPPKTATTDTGADCTSYATT